MSKKPVKICPDCRRVWGTTPMCFTCGVVLLPRQKCLQPVKYAIRSSAWVNPAKPVTHNVNRTHIIYNLFIAAPTFPLEYQKVA